ncbi:hypothetical protein [Leifsonia sp. TF02-11]|uniref:hypothetical protein n=1 Tax=Leifsonia sp. TF02-11 TaxID=2815212 RepID=UPI001AA14F9E|nr:hypothetical protein [Leifsonia sp. TF02-11]MBO1738714.1 hypothetical protein [Leifsonia sp. TF02-11]
MPKPFLDTTDAERRTVNRIVAEPAGRGNGRCFWDVYLYSLGHSEPIAHEAAALDDDPPDQIESYIDHYLQRIGLRRSESLIAGEEGVIRARVERGETLPTEPDR